MSPLEHANLARLVRDGTISDIERDIDYWSSEVKRLTLEIRESWSLKQKRDRLQEREAARKRVASLRAKKRRRMTGPRRGPRKTNR